MCVCVSPQSLQGDVQGLKDRVQELHRDLTKHHSVINTAVMGEVLDRSLGIDRLLAAQHAAVDTMRVMFEEVGYTDPGEPSPTQPTADQIICSAKAFSPPSRVGRSM